MTLRLNDQKKPVDVLVLRAFQEVKKNEDGSPKTIIHLPESTVELPASFAAEMVSAKKASYDLKTKLEIKSKSKKEKKDDSKKDDPAKDN